MGTSQFNGMVIMVTLSYVNLTGKEVQELYK